MGSFCKRGQAVLIGVFVKKVWRAGFYRLNYAVINYKKYKITVLLADKLKLLMPEKPYSSFMVFDFTLNYLNFIIHK